MTSYYNEHDPYAAQWLRNLITAGHIAPGIVDERSIEDVFPSDLRGFTQCHFFAGIGVWSHALRRSGWADSRPVWTGSCPCQPFSSAGQGAAFDDERHLWPAFHHLIKECKPAIVLGEQVASKDADPWIDLVQADVEAMGYAFGAIPFPSAGVGAPHIRDRLYWVAHTHRSARGKGRAHLRGWADGGHAQPWAGSGGSFVSGRLADARHDHAASEGQAAHPGQPQAIGPADQSGGCGGAPCGLDDAGSIGRHASGNADASHDGQQLAAASALQLCGLADDNGKRLRKAGCCELPTGRAEWTERGGDAGGLADPQLQQRQTGQSRLGDVNDAPGRLEGAAASSRLRSDSWTGPVHGFWADADWLLCRDGRWRPVEPGTFPLAHGTPKGMGRSRADWHTPAGKEGQGHRGGRLKGYGNAINAEAAHVFVACVMEATC